MSVLGIDFGNDSCYIGAARAGGIETLANDYSLRATPACAAFGERNRILGVAAKNQQVTNVKNTVYGFKRLLGRKFDDPLAQDELRRLPVKTCRMKDGGIGFQVQYLGQEQVFTPVQLSAMVFSKLLDIAETGPKSTKLAEVVLCVPAYYTDIERRALMDAAKIGGMNVLRLMNETTAAALAYGIYKQDLPLPEEKPRNVIFVDMGYTALQVSAASFNKGKLKMVACTFDRNLGGRDFDDLLASHFCEEFKKTYRVDARTNNRAWLRLLTEVEKLKKQMSANSTVLPINIECFMEEKDVSGRLKRADMEDMAGNLLKRAEIVMKTLQEYTGWKQDDIYAVELIGGSTRIPAIKQIVQKIFNVECSTTLNQDEAVARGCALQCAMLSPNFKVREFSVQDIQQFPVDLYWGTGTNEEGNMALFKQFHQVPFSKSMTFNRREPFYLEARYATEVPHPERLLSRFIVNKVSPTDTGESAQVKCKIRINIHGLCVVPSAYIVDKKDGTTQANDEPMDIDKSNGSQGDDMESSDKKDTANSQENEGDNEQKTADKNAKNSEQGATTNNVKDETPAGKEKESTKPKTIVKHIDLPIEEYFMQLSNTEVVDMSELECKMISWDKQEKDRVDAKNALEEYVYEMRDKMSEELREYIAEQDKTLLQGRFQEIEDWLYDDGENQHKEIYTKKLMEIQEYGEPAKNRKREHEERPGAFTDLNLAIQLANKVIHLYREKDERFNHLEPEEIAKLEKYVSEKMQWFDQQSKSVSGLPLYQNPPVTVAQLRQEKEIFNNLVHPITKKPKPKVEPPPQAEDKKEPGAQPQSADANANSNAQELQGQQSQENMET